MARMACGVCIHLQSSGSVTYVDDCQNGDHFAEWWTIR